MIAALYQNANSTPDPADFCTVPHTVIIAHC